MLIYKATNKLNGKSYIGKTCHNLNHRIAEHLKDVHRGSSLYFHRAIRKHGIEEFDWSIVENVDKSCLSEKEHYYIKFFDTKVPKGYNMTDGGEGTPGRIVTESARKNMGIAQKGNKNSLGCKRSIETREKLRLSHLGRKTGLRTLATRFKIAIAVTGNTNWLGRKHSEETKKKMSAWQKGIKRGPLPDSVKEKLRLVWRRKREIKCQQTLL